MLFKYNIRESIFPSLKMDPMQKNSIIRNSLRLNTREEKKEALAASLARFQAWRITGGVEKGKRKEDNGEGKKRERVGRRGRRGGGEREKAWKKVRVELRWWLHAGIKDGKRAREKNCRQGPPRSHLPAYLSTLQVRPSLSIQHHQLVNFTVGTTDNTAAFIRNDIY